VVQYRAEILVGEVSLFSQQISHLVITLHTYRHYISDYLWNKKAQLTQREARDSLGI